MGLNHAVNEQLLENNYQYKKLFDQHSAIKAELKKASSSLSIDPMRIAQLKRKKLSLADQMLSIESST